MARPTKTGLDYFPFNIDFFQDLKVRKLIKYQGCKAVPVYTLLLCNIYQNGYYMRWDNELPFIISETTGYEEGYVKEVISCCVKVGLLSELMFKQEVLTSKGIQERYILICRQAKRRIVMDEFILVSSEETKVKPETIPINSESSTQSKVKESKVKEIKEEETKEETDVSSSPSDIPDFLRQNREDLEEEIKENPPEFRPAPLTIQQYVDEMKKSVQFMQTACTTRKVTLHEFHQALNEFAEEKKAVGHIPKSEKDIRMHFLNWLSIWKQKLDKQKLLDQQSGPPKGNAQKNYESASNAMQRIMDRRGIKPD